MSSPESQQRSSQFFNFVSQFTRAYWRNWIVRLLGVGLPLAVFGQLALVIWQNTEGFAWDRSLLLAIHGTARPSLDQLALGLTPLGIGWGVIPVTIGVSLRFFQQRRWRSLIYLVVTLLGSLMINYAAKPLLHRLRPALWVSLTPHHSYAFPSGHAMSSMSLVAALVILTWSSRGRGWVLAIGSAYVLTIGWTRLYLGAHFPSDILAGWMISIAWAVMVREWIRPHLTQPNPANPNPTHPNPTHEDQLTPEEEQAIA